VAEFSVEVASKDLQLLMDVARKRGQSPRSLVANLVEGVLADVRLQQLEQSQLEALRNGDSLAREPQNQP
jgi:hypothetical protein